jgi:hypothetical protein
MTIGDRVRHGQGERRLPAASPTRLTTAGPRSTVLDGRLRRRARPISSPAPGSRPAGPPGGRSAGPGASDRQGRSPPAGRTRSPAGHARGRKVAGRPGQAQGSASSSTVVRRREAQPRSGRAPCAPRPGPDRQLDLGGPGGEPVPTNSAPAQYDRRTPERSDPGHGREEYGSGTTSGRRASHCRRNAADIRRPTVERCQRGLARLHAEVAGDDHSLDLGFIADLRIFESRRTGPPGTHS